MDDVFLLVCMFDGSRVVVQWNGIFFCCSFSNTQTHLFLVPGVFVVYWRVTFK